MPVPIPIADAEGPRSLAGAFAGYALLQDVYVVVQTAPLRLIAVGGL